MFMPAEGQKSGDGVVLQPNNVGNFFTMFALLSVPRFTKCFAVRGVVDR